MLFFHVGLHKTGTTFLQQAVFPQWRGVNFIGWPNLELFLRMKEDEIYLVSREGLSGRNWAHHSARDAALRRLSELFPDAKILISFRKHSGFILSSYKQYLQRGGPLEFNGYFDIHQDRGFMKREDYLFRSKLESIERYFHHRPFVFLHDEISSNLAGLLEDLQAYVGGQAPAPNAIRSRRFNKSVGYYPAKLLRWLNARSISEFNPGGKYNLNSDVLKRLRLTPKSICQDWLSFLPSKKFLAHKDLLSIDDYYAGDWDYIKNYAKDRAKLAGHAVEECVASANG